MNLESSSSVIGGRRSSSLYLGGGGARRENPDSASVAGEARTDGLRRVGENGGKDILGLDFGEESNLRGDERRREPGRRRSFDEKAGERKVVA